MNTSLLETEVRAPRTPGAIEVRLARAATPDQVVHLVQVDAKCEGGSDERLIHAL